MRRNLLVALTAVMIAVLLPGCGMRSGREENASAAPGWSTAARDSVRMVVERGFAPRDEVPDSLITPYYIWAAGALLDPEGSREALRHLVTDGTVARSRGYGGGWPVVAADMMWAPAAWEVYLATGDRQWLREAHAVVRNSLRDLMLVSWNADYRLMQGVAPYVEQPRSIYPEWMDAVDLYDSQSLGANVLSAAAFAAHSRMSAELGLTDDPFEGMESILTGAIHRRLWIPALGRFSAYRQGNIYTVASAATDGMGESLSVLLGVATDEMARSMLRLSPDAAADYSPREMAFRCMASASASCGASLDTWLDLMLRGMIIRQDSVRSAAMLTSVCVRSLAGIELHPEGMTIHPFIPRRLAADKHLSPLHYHDAILDITISGTGATIASMKLDGEEMHNRLIPNYLTGHHTIHIRMAGDPLPGLGTELHPLTQPLEAPDVIWQMKRRRYSGAITNYVDTVEYATYTDGVRGAALSDSVWLPQVPSDAVTELALVATAGRRGLSSPSRSELIIPPKHEILFDATEIARGGCRQIKDRKKRKQYVQLTRWVNRHVTFDYTAPSDGDYAVRLLYSNGMGPLDSGDKCALRTLTVNGVPQGAIVMPQTGMDRWIDTRWSSLCRMKLSRGVNTIGIEYLEPQDLNADRNSNTALIRAISIIRL